ncbi:phosphatidylinositol-3-phosphatase ymr1, partial [Coemansia sp. RSA 1591]
YPELHPDYVRPVDPSTGTSAQQKRGFRLGRTKHDHETSPVFQQFLDCVYQLWVQHPTMFEFNERFLLDLFYHGHAAQFGTFLGNNMQERTAIKMQEHTQRVWSVVGHDPQLYRNAVYLGDESKREQRVILPEPRFVQYWSAMFSCHDPAFVKCTEPATRDELIVETASNDPTVRTDPDELTVKPTNLTDSDLALSSNVWSLDA